jgi:hypothetical protein
VKFDGFTNHRFIQVKGLFVDILATGEVTGVDTVPAASVPGLCDHSIMGQINRDWLSSLFAECPAFVKVQSHTITHFLIF